MPYPVNGSYNVPWQRAARGIVIFLLDQSSSMSEKFGGETKIMDNPQKMHVLSDTINRCLNAIIDECEEGGKILPRVDISIITYGPEEKAQSILNENPMSIDELPNKKVGTKKWSEQKEVSGKIETIDRSFDIWFEPKAVNGTHMKQAFEITKGIIEKWVLDHPNSLPPIVVNITDGEYNDGNPKPITDEIVNFGTSDGKTLIFNCHISSSPDTKPITFPTNLNDFPESERYAKELFDISSYIPESFRNTALKNGITVNENAVGFIYNADAVTLIKFIAVGTRTRV